MWWFRHQTLAASLLLCVGSALVACHSEDGEVSRAGSARAAKMLRRIQRREWRRADPDRWLLSSLKDPDAQVRARAALAVGRIGHRHGIRPLANVLRDPDPGVRGAASFALRLCVLDGDLADGAPTRRHARAAVRRVLAREADASVAAALVQTLGWLGDRSDVNRLRAGLSGGQAGSALTAWGILGARIAMTPPEVEPLVKVLRDRSAARRRAAAWALSRLTGSRWRTAANRSALRRAGSDDVDGIVRLWAVRALGPAHTIEHLRWLVRRIDRDADPRVQTEMVRALAAGSKAAGVKLSSALSRHWARVSASHARLVGPELHPMLVGLYGLRRRVRTATVRNFAGELLELADASDATVSYTRVERHSIDLVHCAAAQLWDLGYGRTDRTPTCGTARSDQLDGIWRRRQVVRALSGAQRSDAWKLALLRRYLSDPAAVVRRDAVQAVATTGSALGTRVLLRAIDDTDPAVFAAAAGAIAQLAAHLPEKDLGAALVRRLNKLSPLAEPEATCAAIRAIVALRLPAAVPLLRRYQRTRAWAVRDCANAAVQKLASTSPPSSPGADPPPRPEVELRWAGPLPRRAVLVTHKGQIVLELFPEQAPATVASFARLAARRAYQRSRIGRVISNEMVLAGSRPRNEVLRADPPGLRQRIPCELHDKPFERGSVGMVLAGRDTGQRRFFITLTRQPQLDGRRTQFARVIQGMEVVDRLQPGDRIKDLYLARAKDQDSQSGKPARQR